VVVAVLLVVVGPVVTGQTTEKKTNDIFKKIIWVV